MVGVIFGRRQIFHQLVAGHRRGEVRGRFGRVVDTLVTGRADRLGETPVAVPALVGQLHSLPAGLRGEGRTVFHQIHIGNVLQQPRTPHRDTGEITVDVVFQTNVRIIGSGQNNFRVDSLE